MIKFLILFFILYIIYARFFYPRDTRPLPPKTPFSVQKARDILGIGPNAKKEEINAAYYHQMKKYHPDKGGTKEHAIQINAARQLLLNNLKFHTN